MARAKAQCTCERCGQEFVKIAYKRNRAEAASFEKWAEENITLCPDCWKAEQDSKAVEGLALPALTGIPKQIAWAESIRVKMIRKAREDAHGLEGEEKALADGYIKHIAEGKEESRFWIDNRDSHLFRLPECVAYVKAARKETP